MAAALAALELVDTMAPRWSAQELLQEPWGPQLPHVAALIMAVLQHPETPSTASRPLNQPVTVKHPSGFTYKLPDWETVKKAGVRAANKLASALSRAAWEDDEGEVGEEERQIWEAVMPLFQVLFASMTHDLWQFRHGKSVLQVPTDITARSKKAAASQRLLSLSVRPAHELLLQSLGVVLPRDAWKLWGMDDDRLAASSGDFTATIAVLLCLADKVKGGNFQDSPEAFNTAVLPVMVEVLQLCPLGSPAGLQAWTDALLSVRTWEGLLFARAYRNFNWAVNNGSSTQGTIQQLPLRELLTFVLEPLLHCIIPAASYVALQQELIAGGACAGLRNLVHGLGAMLVLLVTFITSKCSCTARSTLHVCHSSCSVEQQSSAAATSADDPCKVEAHVHMLLTGRQST